MPIEILMPALSPTMEEGTLSKWLIKEGDSVSSGDIMAEIETDKATMEVEAVEEGTVAKILVPEGSESVKVNAPIAVLLEEDEDASVMDSYVPGGAPAPKTEAAPQAPALKADAPKPAPQPAAPQTAPQASSSGTRIKASPLAKRLAAEAGLDLSSISGTGTNGRIVKADIEAAKAGGTAKAAPSPQAASTATSTEVGMPLGGGAEYLTKMGVQAGSYDLIPLNNVQKVVAKRLTESHINVPDFPLTIDCEIDELLKMRKELNAQAPDGVKISVNDMLIRACALALKPVSYTHLTLPTILLV